MFEKHFVTLLCYSDWHPTLLLGPTLLGTFANVSPYSVIRAYSVSDFEKCATLLCYISLLVNWNSRVTGYKFINRLTESSTDDLSETWSCQNHEKVEESLVNPLYIWAKMRLLSVFGPLTGPREPVNWHFLPLEVAWGQVPPGGGIEIWF